PAQPVVHLDLKYIRRTIAENLGALPPEVEFAVRITACAVLSPDEKHRRPGAILPTQHGVADQGAEGEIRVSKRKRQCWAGRAIGIDRISRTARGGSGRTHYRADVLPVDQFSSGSRRGEFPERRVRSAGDERLREELQREI